MFCIIAWERDAAGINIIENLTSLISTDKEELQSKVGNTKVKLKYSSKEFDIYVVSKDTVFLEGIEQLVEKYQIVIFASRHESKSGLPVLSIHVPGNLMGDAKFGGKPWSVCYGNGGYMIETFRYIYNSFIEYGFDKQGWDCCYEATHHGPYISNKPVFYIEIGSTPNEWKNRKAGEILARALLEVTKRQDIKDESYIGISGLHYASNLSRKCLKRNIPLAHIIPRYVIESISRDEATLLSVLREVVKKSIGLKGFVIERKSLKSRLRHKVLELIKKEYHELSLMRI